MSGPVTTCCTQMYSRAYQVLLLSLQGRFLWDHSGIWSREEDFQTQHFRSHRQCWCSPRSVFENQVSSRFQPITCISLFPVLRWEGPSPRAVQVSPGRAAAILTSGTSGAHGSSVCLLLCHSEPETLLSGPLCVHHSLLVTARSGPHSRQVEGLQRQHDQSWV